MNDFLNGLPAQSFLHRVPSNVVHSVVIPSDQLSSWVHVLNIFHCSFEWAPEGVACEKNCEESRNNDGKPRVKDLPRDHFENLLENHLDRPSHLSSPLSASWAPPQRSTTWWRWWRWCRQQRSGRGWSQLHTPSYPQYDFEKQQMRVWTTFSRSVSLWGTQFNTVVCNPRKNYDRSTQCWRQSSSFSPIPLPHLPLLLLLHLL